MKKSLTFFTFLCVVAFLLGTFHSCFSDQTSDTVSAAAGVAGFDSVTGMSTFKSSQIELSYSQDSRTTREGARSLKIQYTLHDGEKPFIGFVVKTLGHAVDWSQYDGVSFWSYIPKSSEDLQNLSIMLYQDDGAAYIAQFARKLSGTGWEKSKVPFSTFVYSSGGGFFKNKSEPLNVKKIRKIAVGIYQPVPFNDKTFTVFISQLSPYSERGTEAGAAAPPAASSSPEEKDRTASVDSFVSALSDWKTNASNTVILNYAVDKGLKRNEGNTLKLDYRFKTNKPFWGFAEKDFGSPRDWSRYDAVHVSSYVPVPSRDLVDFSIILYEEGGGAYIAQHVRGLKTTGWEDATVPFSRFFPAGDWAKDDNGTLDPDRIKKIGIGIFQPNNFSDTAFTFYVADLKAISTMEKAASPSNSAPVVRKNQLQKLEPPDGKVYLGVFAFSAPQKGWGKRMSDWEEQVDPKQIAEFERAAGKPVAIASFIWFLDWDFPTKLCEKLNALGKVPQVGITSGDIKPTDIVQGKEDGKLSKWAKSARAYGKPVFFRFFAEMNGNWNNYSEAKDPSQTHQMYVKAWRHVVSIFRKEGASNIVWVWAPTSVDVGNVHWADYYPGDEYVDWVGISVYSFLGNGDPETQIMGIYRDYAARKPIMIAECGAGGSERDPQNYKPGHSYSDNPEKWINRFFDTLETKASRVKAFAWFNIDRERMWKIQESPAKTELFRKRIANSRYLSAVRPGPAVVER